MGCVGLIAVAVAGMAVVFALAWHGVEDEQIEERCLEQPIPVHVLEAPAAPVTGDSEATHPVASDDASLAGAGIVTLDLSGAEFEVLPGEPGEPIAVEAKFDRNTYTLEEEFQDAADDQPWQYRLTFRRSGSVSFITTLKRLISGSSPRVQISLPPDVPLELELRVEEGGSEVSLGGLWLTEAEFDFEKGGMVLDIDRPLKEPMQRLAIDASMGGCALYELGNASPRLLDIDYRMGGMDMDLRGAWVGDAEISIRGRMGGASVRLPSDVRVLGVPGNALYVEDEEEIPGPTLSFSVDVDMGEIDFNG
jgi:hypothetical protein